MDLKLPNLGEGADSGVVVNVFVKEGDTITKDQLLLELENEKAVASIPASNAGVVAKVYVKPGDKLSVGQRILSLAESGKPAEPAKPASGAPKKEAVPEPEAVEAVSATEVEEEIPQPVAAPVTSPSIRRLARELSIDLNKVRGSEPGGRIVVSDIRAYIDRLQKLATRAKPDVPPVEKPKSEAIDFSKWGPISKKPLIPLRQTIARRMLENWNTIPHVTQFDEADVTALNDLRRKHAPTYEQKGTRLTLTAFVVQVVVETLKKHPMFNSSLDEIANELIIKEYFHISIAVDTEQGLIVPVLRDADKKSLFQIAKELEEMARKARERRVALEELKGGSFTISNQGGIGGAHFTPIINKPEVAILGIGRGALKPVVRDGKVEIRMLAPLGLSYDHRVIDGAMAARFITDLVQSLQQFPESLVKL